MSLEQHPDDDTLQLARDLCIGMAAFFVDAAGEVRTTLPTGEGARWPGSAATGADDMGHRLGQLARDSLEHPGARGESLFWNAEVADEGREDLSPDQSLAGVIAPVWHGDRWLGLLGVVDVWLPELDEEQSEGLAALARAFGSLVATDDPADPPADDPADPPADDPADPQAIAPLTGGERPPGATTHEPFLAEVLDNLTAGLVVTRVDGAIVLANRTFAAMAGLPIDDVLGEDARTIFSVEGSAPGGDDRTGPLADLLGRPAEATGLVTGAAGAPTAVSTSGRQMASRFAGDCFVTLVRQPDAAGTAGAAGAAGTGGARTEPLLDSLDEGIVSCDPSGTVLLANQAARDLHGLPEEQLIVGAPFPEATALRTADGELVTAATHPLGRALREGVPVSANLVLKADGSPTVHVAVSARPLVRGGGGAIAVLRDVTAERQQQSQLTHAALHDSLTGLANRTLMVEELERMLIGLTRRGGVVSAVYLDLDQFKAVNDQHGHDIGDEVLRAVGRRIQGAVRGDDVVARIGGDEFVVAHIGPAGPSDADLVVARIRKALSAPYRFGSLVIGVGVSVGWASTSAGDATPEALLVRADQSMYESKRGRSAVSYGAAS